MPKPGCPEWEYEKHSQRTALIPKRVLDLIAAIYSDRYTATLACTDTRPVHLDLFTGLTPAGHPYYAGHFRGERDCLIGYEVHVSALSTLTTDSTVGAPSNLTPHEMARFSKLLLKRLRELESLKSVPILLDSGIRMATVVKFACSAFVTFLTIHPFANGNGHIARTLLWAILFHFGYATPGWTIDPRPAHPDYATMIAAHRRGNVDQLEQYIISTLAIVKKKA